MKNPYKGLDASRFWKTGVAEADPHTLEQIHQPKWPIRKSDTFITMGSCFAQHLGRKLKSLDFNVPYFDNPDRVRMITYSANYGNVYTVRQAVQLLLEVRGEHAASESAWETDDGFIDPFRPGVFGTHFPTPEDLASSRREHLTAVRKAIQSLDVFVFTLGLTEAWIMNACGSALPSAPGVMGGAYNPNAHSFKNFSSGEVSHDLRQLIDLVHDLREGRPFRMLLTVSPVPLTATAANRHILVSSTYSKAVLRAVAGEVCAQYDFVDYFPSYEIITNPKSVRSNYLDNLREVDLAAVDRVMAHFQKAYLGAGDELDHTSMKPSARHKQPHDIQAAAGIGDVECEEALLEQFSDTVANHENERDILVTGNSHLGYLRNALKQSNLMRRCAFVPVNFLANAPMEELEEKRYRSFHFSNDEFEAVELPAARHLVIVGYGLFGDCIARAFGPLKGGYEGCIGTDISPSLPTHIDEMPHGVQMFERHICSHLKRTALIAEKAGFESISWIVSPDIPEKVAIFRFGDEFVNSGSFKRIKRKYREIFDRLRIEFCPTVDFYLHEKEHLYASSGFAKSRYNRALPWDVHANVPFYKDGGAVTWLEERLD